MTTHDVHRAMEENLLGFQRHTSHLAGTAPAFRSMTASDLISLLPTSTNSQQQQQQQRRRTSQPIRRPNSDILQAAHMLNNNSPEAEAIDRWFENLQRYEQMLEEVAAASLDQDFKDELQHINQWFRCRSDAERTAALYSVVQNASQIQIRFLITVLQQLANQDPLGALLSPAGQEKDLHHHQQQHHSPFTPVAGSVVSTESEYELRKRQMYPPSRRATRTPLCNRLSSALSEPDDLRRRDLLMPPRSLGLSQQGMLYEKALAFRAQVQAAHNSNSGSMSSSSSVNSVGFSPRASYSTTDTSTCSNTRNSLFGSDWPFPLVRNSTEKPLVGRIGDRPSSITSTTSSELSKKKKEFDLPWARKSDTIKEDRVAEEQEQSSLTALELAQARLRKESPSWNKRSQASAPSTSSTPTATPPSAPPRPSVTRSTVHNNSNNNNSNDINSALEPKPEKQQQYGQFLSPNLPEHDNSEDLSDHSDTSNVSKDQAQLTGTARRRKRSSAARALKDKLAAETVDFELMKDVQNWLRSLRLHKYGHAFEGLQWQQVIRMSDEDMLNAGVNTIGARRKLLKVFENVQRHCKENDIQF
ncbi:Flap-structured DNA-binding and RNA-binding protein [Apophysomyces ossiformis]|uniref:Flap-structured DNA-binding and RNA-binding protein n=1 Tax=Apophysomyces ossiformis TaxID=679940 RepID=A0A8H7BLD2_9FUNG|nr:Flap-structured DNA-binding and RNA-binding protein [Apophysomyces ossiformis]